MAYADPEKEKANHRERSRRYRERHPDRVRASGRAYEEKNRGAIRDRQLRKAYNITLEQYRAMLDDQRGVCLICGLPDENKNLAVDHDHNCCPGRKSCGKCIRGLLCSKCNQAIGLLGDNPELMEKAAAYVRVQ